MRSDQSIWYTMFGKANDEMRSNPMSHAAGGKFTDAWSGRGRGQKRN